MMRRLPVCLLTLLLFVSVCFWIIYVPPEAMRILKPVPAHAQIIRRGAQPDLYAPEQFRLFAGSASAEQFFRMFSDRPGITASVDLGGRNRRDTLVMVSPAGARAFLLRWRLNLFPPEGMKPIRSYGAWPVWQYSNPSLPPWMRVRFSVTEGLLICSISDDSHDIYYLLDTLDGRRPSADRKE